MKILVTGSTGFIGKHLVKRLLSNGHEVRCLIRETSVKPVEFINSVEWYIGNFADPYTLTPALRGVDAVIHLAGCIKAKKKSDYYSINYYGTKNLVDAMQKACKEGTKLIYVSSQSAAGPSSSPGAPQRENDPAYPISAYGDSKLAGEIAVSKARNRFNVVIIRPAIVYGPGDRETLLFFKYARKHIRPVIGFKERYISIVHISDLVKMVLLTLDKKIESGEVFFVSDGKIYTTRELFKLISKLMSTWIVPVPIPLTFVCIAALLNNAMGYLSGKVTMLNIDKYKELKALYWICSSEKAAKEGFSPDYDLKKGLQETYQWYIENGWL